MAGAAYDRGDVSEATRHYERVLFLSGGPSAHHNSVLFRNLHCPHAETFAGCVGGVGASKSKDRPKDAQLKRISQMSVAAKLNLSSLYLKMDKAVQACKL